MTTCVVVKKAGEVAIAADALVTFGDTRLTRAYERNQKVFPVGDSFVALAGTTAHFPVMRSLLAGLGEDCRLGSRDDVFRTFLKVHEKLKNEYFINTKEDEDDPYESSQIVCLIANPAGIFGVYSYREVFSFDRFWGIGSGRNYALGAMHAVYDQPGLAAREIARIGVDAGVEFDKSSAGPVEVQVVQLADMAGDGATNNDGAPRI
ncbi:MULTISPECIES: MFS transporter [Cupriavidus]|uniref:MFS transporter n=1 Tax=Cupriavidus basilensis TaxID=68895 RepID=A0A643FQZ7_9BURK|nr:MULTISPECIES: MFS transporter [Cupriavidus]MBB1630081.1 MFS transporter [Cupriavidus sp. UME77]MCP3021106.1 MFS transporter [Cupriavidus basilensis]MDR3384007.1 MFS transporter [Cupriavidus basilensis]NUA25503.1 MFS transporter [Cupriavidus basilensis]QOT77790.1 MFS transporter [Cupriavidus basilensis]